MLTAGVAALLRVPLVLLVQALPLVWCITAAFSDSSGRQYTIYVSETKTSLPMARYYCNSKGGELASIHSKKENDFIANLTNHPFNEYWIGLYNSYIFDGHNTTKGLAWFDDSPFDYGNELDVGKAPWATNYPEYSIYCTFMGKGKWMDCSELCCLGRGSLHFVCKIPCSAPPPPASAAPPATVYIHSSTSSVGLWIAVLLLSVLCGILITGIICNSGRLRAFYRRRRRGRIPHSLEDDSCYDPHSSTSSIILHE